MITIKSPYELNETLGRLLKALVENDMTIFAIVDHSGGAAQFDLSMPDTKLIIFGNPKGGTDLMLADPDFSIDLPLKIVLRNSKDETEIFYQSIGELATRYDVTELNEKIQKMDKSIESLINKVINK
ncbi:MAG: DUF302 domain-containing protein [Methanobacterium sp.]